MLTADTQIISHICKTAPALVKQVYIINLSDNLTSNDFTQYPHGKISLDVPH